MTPDQSAARFGTTVFGASEIERLLKEGRGLSLVHSSFPEETKVSNLVTGEEWIAAVPDRYQADAKDALRAASKEVVRVREEGLAFLLVDFADFISTWVSENVAAKP